MKRVSNIGVESRRWRLASFNEDGCPKELSLAVFLSTAYVFSWPLQTAHAIIQISGLCDATSDEFYRVVISSCKCMNNYKFHAHSFVCVCDFV